MTGQINVNKIAARTGTTITIDTGSYPLLENTSYVLKGYAKDSAGNLSAVDNFLWETPSYENASNSYGCDSHNTSNVDHSGLSHTHP